MQPSHEDAVARARLDEAESRPPFSQAMRNIWFLVAVTVTLVAVADANFLLFHSLVEILTISASWAIVALIWNTKRRHRSFSVIWLGAAFLACGGLDLLHTLTYKGMGVFPGQGANMPTQFWIGSRILHAAFFLFSLGALERRSTSDAPLLVAVVSGAGVGWLIFTGLFPDAFIEGQGLTRFKIVTEYVIAVSFTLYAAGLQLRRERVVGYDVRLMQAGAVFMVLAEIMFTTYASVYGFSNMVGHLLRLAATYFFYFAVVDAGISRPLQLVFRESELKEKLLQEKDLMLRSVFERLPVGLVLVRPVRGESGACVGATVVEVNPRYEAMTGRKRDDLVGRNWNEIEPGLAALDEALTGAVCSPAAPNGPAARFQAQSADRDSWLSVTAFPLREGLAALVLEDVTELRRAYETLTQAKLQAESANLAKTGFLANMSHEIRTPLAGIIGAVEMLLAMDKDPERAEHLQRVKRSSAALQNIINDLLDISRIEVGKLALSERAFDPVALLTDTVATFRPAAEAKGLFLHANVSPNLPRALSGDPLRIQQVLVNLIGNAIKFTDAGGVTVSAETVNLPPDDAGRARVRLTLRVRDTGPGIAPESRRAIFEPFRQLDSGYAKKAQGAGLGLAICRRLLELMGGSIEAESAPGAGSEFVVEMPLTVAAQDAPDERPSSAAVSASVVQAGAARRPLRILLAEDQDTISVFLKFFLERMGAEVILAADGLRAVEAWNGQPVDLVLMDVQMPGLDGLEATRAIRGLERDQHRPRTPIVALTAYAMPGDQERFLGAGMDGYLSKPVDIQELEGVIRRFSPVAIPGGALPGQSSGDDDPFAELRALYPEALVRQVLAAFLAETPQRRAALGAALAAGDQRALARAAHGLIGMLGSLRLHDQEAAAREIERLAGQGDMGRAAETALALGAALDRAIEALKA